MTQGDESRDQFLGGRLTIAQPQKGYRAGVDPVFLAAATPAKAGESVLELGCGVGTAALCLAARVPGLQIAGLEIQPAYAALARRNAHENAIAMDVYEGDLIQPPAELRQRSFNHVIANPPYFLRAAGTGAENAGRETALGEGVPLRAWVDAALRRLAPRGRLTMIQRAERLPDLLAAFDNRAGAIEVLPLQPRIGRSVRLVLLRAVKSARTPFRLLPATILHEGAAHDGDRESYRPEIAQVLRNAAEFPWPGA